MHSKSDNQKSEKPFLHRKNTDSNKIKQAHESNLLFSAIKNNDLKSIERVLTEKNINGVDNHGNTPLIIAASNGNDELVDLLIKRKADINVRNDDGDTALNLACAKGHSKVIQSLFINYITNHNLTLNAPNNAGQTPLKSAIYNNHVKIVGLLHLYSIDTLINSQGYNRSHPYIHPHEYPLIYAAHLGRFEIVKLIIDTKKLFNIYEINEALTEATFNKHTKVSNYLYDFIQKLKSNVDLLSSSFWLCDIFDNIDGCFWLRDISENINKLGSTSLSDNNAPANDLEVKLDGVDNQKSINDNITKPNFTENSYSLQR